MGWWYGETFWWLSKIRTFWLFVCLFVVMYQSHKAFCFIFSRICSLHILCRQLLISYSPLNSVHAHRSQTHLFVCGVTPSSCSITPLSLFKILPNSSKSKTAAPLLQKLLPFFFFSVTILSQLLWYKILKLILISFSLLPFMFVSVV